MPDNDNASSESTVNPIARILALRRTLLENPESAEAHCDLGVAMYQNGDAKTAITYLKQAIQLDENHERSYYNLGLCYQTIGFIDSAISCYEAVIRLNPKDDQAWNNLAALFSQRHEYKESIECYQKAIGVKAQNSQIWISLATVQYLAGQYKDAVDSATQAIELDERHYFYWLQLGQAHYALHDADPAITAFLKASELNPADTASWNCLGNAYLLKESLQEAEEAYRKAISLDGNNTDYWFNLGELLYQKKDYAEAASCFSKVVHENKDDIEALEYLAKSSLYVTPMDAANRLHELIKLKGELPEYLQLLAEAYHQSEKSELEVKTRLKLASVNPMFAENNYALAQLLLERGNRDLAFSFLKDSKPRSDSDPNLWFRLAQSFRLDNRMEEEFQCLTGTVKADPRHQQAWFRLGSMALENDIESNALQYLERAGQLLKNHCPFWLSTAYRFIDHGKSNLAIQCALQLVDLIPFAPRIWKDLLKRFRRSGDLPKLIDSISGYVSAHSDSSLLKSAALDLILRNGHPQEAQLFLEKTWPLNRTEPDAVCAWVKCYLASGELEKAETIIKDVPEENHAHYGLFVLQAEIQLLRNQTEAAETSIHDAHQLRQDHYHSWLVMGKILHQKSANREALETLEKALSINPDNMDIWLWKGRVLAAMDQDFEAEKAFWEVLKLERRHSDSWLSLGDLKSKQQEFPLARRYLLKALATHRKNRTAWLALSDVFHRLGLNQKADACQEEADRLSAEQT